MTIPNSPENGLSDRTLVKRVRRGQGDAFNALVRRYLRPALAVAWEFTESRDDAEDIVQEAFSRALRGLQEFDEKRPFRPWFFTIVRNVGRNTAAWRSRWGYEPLSETLPSGGGDPLSDAERREVQERIDAGLDLPEVAEMLGLEESTVRVHLHRARGGLRKALRPLREERGSA
jgi:RNA polymerase sigma-70 factor (ECF subfamily)